MEYVIAAIVLGGFGYFIYRKVKARGTVGGGTGGGGMPGKGDEPTQDEK